MLMEVKKFFRKNILKSNSFFATILAISLFSCGNHSEKSNETSDVVISKIDTVIVDSQNEALFLNWGLSNASLSTDSRFLYNLNIDETSLEIIDLDQVSFVNKIKLEKEGPDGIGNNGRGGIISLNDSLIYFSGYPASIIMTTRGKKSPLLNNLPTLKKKFTDLGKDLLYEKVNPKNLQSIYGILVKFPGLAHELGMLNLNTGDTSRIELPEWENLENFSMILNNPDFYDVYEARIFLKYLNDKVILGTNVKSHLYVFDITQEKLDYVKIENTVTSPERVAKLPKEVSDPDQYFSLWKKTESEITFHEPVWDNENQWYYRLAHVNKFDDDITGYPTPSSAHVYINILDKNFKLVSEIPLTQLNTAPSFYFAKDGKLWLFKNIDDEMAFIRIEFRNKN